MKAGTAAVAVVVWTLLVAAGAGTLGYSIRDGRQATKDVQTLRKAAVAKARKDDKSVAAGVRAERAETRADQTFQTIRSDYEADLRKNPAAGCVLDPDSLRRWNEANAESERDAPSEPDGALSAASQGEAGPERGNEPH